MKQYLIATSFTSSNVPLEYEYTVDKCDMRTAHSKQREKYVRNKRLEKLFKIAYINNVKLKIGRGGEICFIMTCGAMARAFLSNIEENGWEGVKLK